MKVVMKRMVGWMGTLALALALPALAATAVAAEPGAKAKTGEETGSMSKDEADKVKEHTKLRTQITKMKYPASKTTIVSKVKGMKPDDRKWFTETLPDKTYNSADDVFQALGWPSTAEAEPAK